MPINRSTATAGAATAHARMRAEQIIEEYGIRFPVDIDVSAIALVRGVHVRESQIEGSEAWLVRVGDKGLIRVKADIPEGGRKRFAIGHELGHWELHPGLSQWKECSEGDMMDYQSSPPEVEANAFASSLLMPSSMFKPQCNTGDLNVGMVVDLSREFRTTLTATAIRIIEERNDNCFAVFSKNGTVLWWKRSDGSGLFIPSRHCIDRMSSARQCVGGGITPASMQQVSASSWFPALASRSDEMEVHEQSMSLGYHGMVLTMLWVTGE